MSILHTNILQHENFLNYMQFCTMHPSTAYVYSQCPSLPLVKYYHPHLPNNQTVAGNLNVHVRPRLNCCECEKITALFLYTCTVHYTPI